MTEPRREDAATETELRSALSLALRALMHAEKLIVVHHQAWSLVREARVTAAATLDKGRDERNEQVAT